MPAFVRTREDETNWTAAKRAAKEQGKVKEGSDRYWRLVTAIFKKKGGGK